MIKLNHQKQLKGAIRRLKDQGIRITPQRQAVLEYLIEFKSHPTADEIYRALETKFPNMSVATVYNNLRTFKEAGLLNELTFGDSSSRFDYSEDFHYHVSCEECGKIVDFDFSGLTKAEKSAEEETGFVITHHRMELYGYCPDCKEAGVQVSV